MRFAQDLTGSSRAKLKWGTWFSDPCAFSYFTSKMIGLDLIREVQGFWPSNMNSERVVISKHMD